MVVSRGVIVDGVVEPIVVVDTLCGSCGHESTLYSSVVIMELIVVWEPRFGNGNNCDLGV